MSSTKWDFTGIPTKKHQIQLIDYVVDLHRSDLLSIVSKWIFSENFSQFFEGNETIFFQVARPVKFAMNISTTTLVFKDENA